jgi:hypothetical protein
MAAKPIKRNSLEDPPPVRQQKRLPFIMQLRPGVATSRPEGSLQKAMLPNPVLAK